jgi:4-oxalocrotonate tautomerase family enzyme
MWSGRTEKQKAEIIKGITETFVSQGVPASAVTVIVFDVDKSNWGHGGLPASST